MAKAKNDRRSEELSGLDIDRRKVDGRRDDKRRPWLGKAYEEIYITSYVNSIYPRFASRVHALSNLEGDEELSGAEWAVANLAISDAGAGMPLRGIQGFAGEMIGKGLVVDEMGKAVLSGGNVRVDVLEHYFLRTGS
ncbi:MAG: hypothetical protein EOP10_06995 [Proteobacteria bacterium]|nr:MAG: hypothetical protein EOP10_06995 [Pseudomonadota bacterium]